MRLVLFSDEHEAPREAVRAWVAEHVVPHQERWQRQGRSTGRCL